MDPALFFSCVSYTTYGASVAFWFWFIFFDLFMEQMATTCVIN